MLRFLDRLAQGGRLYALSVVYLALFPGAARGLSKIDRGQTIFQLKKEGAFHFKGRSSAPGARLIGLSRTAAMPPRDKICHLSYRALARVIRSSELLRISERAISHAVGDPS